MNATTLQIQLAINGQPEVFDVPVAASSMTLAALVPLAYAITERLIEHEEARRRGLGKVVTCQAKCTQCCHQLVVLTVPEALHLEEAITAGGGELAARFAAHDQTLERRGWVDELFNPTFSETPPHLPIALDYFRAQLPCPALEDDLCSIYTERPLACRTHSVTSDPRLCAKPFDGEVEKVSLPHSLSPTLAHVAAKLLEADPLMIPLALFPRWLRDNGAAARKRFEPQQLFDAFTAALG